MKSFLFLYKPNNTQWKILEKSEDEVYTSNSIQQCAINLLESGNVEYVDFRMTRNDSLDFIDIRVIRSQDSLKYNLSF